MNIELAYGHETIRADVPWGRCAGTIDVVDAPELPNRDAAIREALENPIGLDRGILQLVRPGERVAILVSDSFRVTAIDQVLPILIEGLNSAGVPDEAIRIVFASGTHRPPRLDEQERIVGPALFARMRARCFAHDPRDDANLTYVGTTSRGTRVEVNKHARDCNRIIVTGAVVLHYFGGFGGGRKGIVPGIASARTIAHNHAMNLHPTEDKLNPAVRIGVLDGNPVAEDMLEAAKLVNVDCIINTVLNRRAQIAGIFAGELDAAHRKAAAFAREMYAVPIRERADLVIASSGGTKNFVQTHKALYNAYQAMKPGGRIVLVARCPEGLGGDKYASWLKLGSRSAIIAELRKQSEINGQTALSTREKGPFAILVTELPDNAVKLIGAQRAATLQGAIDIARSDLQRTGIDDPAYYLMPSAAYTVPFP